MTGAVVDTLFRSRLSVTLLCVLVPAPPAATVAERLRVELIEPFQNVAGRRGNALVIVSHTEGARFQVSSTPFRDEPKQVGARFKG